ncbi:MAG: WbqC family protein [Bacteroidia bacterium]|nr:WbqC family protein [Bacteroidia bacterium]MCX7764015.1 WbqC family protein [Bacteroidia bacterium]
MEVLPAFLWPPKSWVEHANRLRKFFIGYPARLPKGSCYTRYRIIGERWLSIPIIHASKRTPFEATWPPETRWRLYHWRTLLTLYGKAPFFYEWKPFLEYLYLEAPLSRLADVAELIIQELARLYHWQVEWKPEDAPIYFPCSAAEVSILDQLLRSGP